MTIPSPELFDITLPLTDRVLVYPGDSPPCILRVSDHKKGDSLTASTFSMGCHVGTHVDAPAHFVEDGLLLNDLPMESFYGPAVVLSIMGKRVIKKEDVEENAIPAIPKRHHILLKTDNSDLLEKNNFSKECSSLTLFGKIVLF